MRTAALEVAAVCMLAAGCGSALARGPASTGTPGLGSAQKLSQPTSAGNKARAIKEAARLLALVPLPSGAVTINRVPGALLHPELPNVTSLIDQHRSWRLPMPVAQAGAWLRTHRPAGLRWQSSGTEGPPASASYSYTGPASPAWESTQLEVEFASSGTGATVMRADGIVVWLDPTPVPDTGDGRGRRVHVTVAGGCPRSDRYLGGVANSGADLRHLLLPATTPTGGLECTYYGLNGQRFRLRSTAHLTAAGARQVARNMGRLPLAHALGEVTSCPEDDGSAAVVVLSYAGRPDVDLLVGLTGCATAANGFITTSFDSNSGPACLASGLPACLRP